MSEKTLIHQYRILVICEGDEEVMYLQALVDLGVFDPQYEIIPKLATLTPGDSGGAGKVPMVFQYYWSTANYDAIYFMIDVDAEPHEAFESVKKNVNAIMPRLFEKHVLYTNPCTLQLMVFHFEKTILPNQSKMNNSDTIKRIWPKIRKMYSAKHYQLEIMRSEFDKVNYSSMKSNFHSLDSGDVYTAPSSNLVAFFEHLENKDPSWLTK